MIGMTINKKLLLKIISAGITLSGAIVTLVINDSETRDLEDKIYNRVYDDVMKNVISTVQNKEAM